MKTRPNVLTIAGFDPSGGAGLTADIKAIENLKGYGFAVQTANTIQNDIEFKTCHWVDVEVVKKQVEILFDRFVIDYVKIGIVENWNVLNEIIDLLLEKNKNIKVVLDPVLRSSSDFSFHDLSNSKNDTQFKKIHSLFDEILTKVYLVTPNYVEIGLLYPDKNIEETIRHISSKTNLLLKGGHDEVSIGKDRLFMVTGEQYVFNSKGRNLSEKHGSGCVLSSAITTYLAQDFNLLKACFRGKRYIEKVLGSNKSLLGYHK